MAKAATSKPTKAKTTKATKATATKTKAGGADLAAPVWANPDDDDLRQVTADAMLERGEPWGELITLQLRKNGPNKKQQARIKELLDEHAKTWLGPIANISLVSLTRWKRGFPEGIQLLPVARSRSEWEAALKAPHWATIRHLAIDGTHTPKWWITGWVKHPANRAVKFEVGTLASSRLSIQREPGQPWTLQIAWRNSLPSCAPILKAFNAGLPAGQTVAMRAEYSAWLAG